MSKIGQFVLSKNNKYFIEDCGRNPFWKICIPKGFSFGPVWVVALLAAVSHIFIDLRFEPYGFEFYPTEVKVILSFFYGIVMGGGFWIAHLIVYNEYKYWAIWKEFVWAVITVFLITNVNFLFRVFLFRYVYDLHELYPIQYWRYMLIGVEVAGTTALAFKFMQIMLVKSGLYNIGLSNFALEEKLSVVKIYGPDRELLTDLALDSFIYAESEGNYVKINCVDKSQVLRLSLSSLEEQLSRFSQVKRVQKSFLANFDQNFSLEGNSRKAFLTYDSEKQIPVSRQFYKQCQSEGWL